MTYDELAEAFYRATGMMAPGKDMPAAMGAWPTQGERREAWMNWLQTTRIRALEMAQAAVKVQIEAKAPDPVRAAWAHVQQLVLLGETDPSVHMAAAVLRAVL